MTAMKGASVVHLRWFDFFFLAMELLMDLRGHGLGAKRR